LTAADDDANFTPPSSATGWATSHYRYHAALQLAEADERLHLCMMTPADNNFATLQPPGRLAMPLAQDADLSPQLSHFVT